MAKFKAGDRVRVIGSNNGQYHLNSTCNEGGEYTIIAHGKNTGYWYQFEDQTWAWEEELKLIGNNHKNMNIKEKFITSLLPEPEKTFRKLGITDSDGLLTSEGRDIYLSWRLKQDKVQFNTDVATPMLAEQDSECK